MNLYILIFINHSFVSSLVNVRFIYLFTIQLFFFFCHLRSYWHGHVLIDNFQIRIRSSVSKIQNEEDVFQMFQNGIFTKCAVNCTWLASSRTGYHAYQKKRRTPWFMTKRDKKNNFNYFHLSHFWRFSKNLSF